MNDAGTPYADPETVRKPAAVTLPGGVAAGGLIDRMNIVLTEASAERVVATMPVAGNTQPYGLLHGGASVVLVETLGSVAAALHAGPGRIAVGIEVNATHHRAVAKGTVTGVATPRHRGGTLATYDVEVTDDGGHRICTGRLTCLLRPSPPGATPDSPRP